MATSSDAREARRARRFILRGRVAAMARLSVVLALALLTSPVAAARCMQLRPSASLAANASASNDDNAFTHSPWPFAAAASVAVRPLTRAQGDAPAASARRTAATSPRDDARNRAMSFGSARVADGDGDASNHARASAAAAIRSPRSA